MNEERPAPKPPRRARRRRADIRDTRRALIAAAARLLSEGRPLTMRGVAAVAGVSRSTLYRHFDNQVEVQCALQQQALATASAAIEQSLSQGKPLLAEARSVVSSLVATGAELPIELPIGPPPEQAVIDLGERLHPLVERLARAADLLAPPGAPWLHAATPRTSLRPASAPAGANGPM